MNSNIKIAYIVLCHKNAGQINKMIKKLDSKNCDFFLHIDKKSSIEEDIIKNNHIFVWLCHNKWLILTRNSV